MRTASSAPLRAVYLRGLLLLAAGAVLIVVDTLAPRPAGAVRPAPVIGVPQHPA